VSQAFGGAEESGWNACPARTCAVSANAVQAAGRRRASTV